MIFYKEDNQWISEEIDFFEDYEDNYYYLYESFEFLNGHKYHAFPNFIRECLNNCESSVQGKKSNFRF